MQIKKPILAIFTVLVALMCGTLVYQKKHEKLDISHVKNDILFIDEKILNSNNIFKQNEAILEQMISAEEQDLYYDAIKNAKFWKKGIFVKGKYSGKNLVLGQFKCESDYTMEKECNLYGRFAVDFDKNEWIFLKKYSDAFNIAQFLPFASEDAFYTINEFDIPEALNFYSDTHVLLQDRIFGTLNSQTFIESEKLEQTVDKFSSVFAHNSCVYGDMPDGTIARYSSVPKSYINVFNELMQSKKMSSQIYEELTILSKDQPKIQRKYGINFESCLSECLKAYFPDQEELTMLKVLGNIDGVQVYTLAGDLYKNSSETSLRSAVKSAHKEYLSIFKDQSGKTPLTLNEFVSQNRVFFIKMDPAYYILAYDSNFYPNKTCQ